MVKLLLTALLFASLFSYGQNTPKPNIDLTVKQDSIAYVQKCIEFIKQVMQPELSDANFILADKPFSPHYFDCIKNIPADTTFYTKEELLFIKNKKDPSLSYWTKELFRDIKLVSSDTINVIFRDKSKWWPYFNKNIGRSFNTFSAPLFFRNDTYCLFYSDHHCGGLCGTGRLTLYKKEEGKWIEVKSYCNWIS